MNINIQAIDFSATQALQDFINKKAGKLTKHYDELQNLDVYLKVVKPETSLNKEAQVKATAPNAEFFAAKTCDTFEEAVTQCLEAIERQIVKHKEKNK